MKILVLEPYYGGSHKAFLDGLQTHLPGDFSLLTLPAARWKWRMRLAAPYFAGQIVKCYRERGFNALLCSSFMDVATLRGLLPSPVNRLPFYTYFHENQFNYPVRREDERDVHFCLTNLTTVLASDSAAFSSAYNRHTFLQGAARILRMCPDMMPAGALEEAAAKSVILHPGIDFSLLDSVARQGGRSTASPVVVWNHRWEHDKHPAVFFQALFELAAEGVDFGLIVLGQSFRDKPAIFAEAREKLQDRILHYGFLESRTAYCRMLAKGDIVVSTAGHEFYGISVIEAVRAGCLPLLPNRLSYPELFPARYLYEENELIPRLRKLLQVQPAERFDSRETRDLTDRFSWQQLRETYMSWLDSPERHAPTA